MVAFVAPCPCGSARGSSRTQAHERSVRGAVYPRSSSHGAGQPPSRSGRWRMRLQRLRRQSSDPTTWGEVSSEARRSGDPARTSLRRRWPGRTAKKTKRCSFHSRETVSAASSQRPCLCEPPSVVAARAPLLPTTWVEDEGPTSSRNTGQAQRRPTYPAIHYSWSARSTTGPPRRTRCRASPARPRRRPACGRGT